MTSIEQLISDIIYDELDYMYCDNCRFNSELASEYSCEDCHRKYNNWGISSACANDLSDKIIEFVNKYISDNNTEDIVKNELR